MKKSNDTIAYFSIRKKTLKKIVLYIFYLLLSTTVARGQEAVPELEIEEEYRVV